MAQKDHSAQDIREALEGVGQGAFDTPAAYTAFRDALGFDVPQEGYDAGGNKVQGPDVAAQAQEPRRFVRQPDGTITDQDGNVLEIEERAANTSPGQFEQSEPTMAEPVQQSQTGDNPGTVLP